MSVANCPFLAVKGCTVFAVLCIEFSLNSDGYNSVNENHLTWKLPHTTKVILPERKDKNLVKTKEVPTV